mgnify:CR=1 FL=1
MKVGRVVRALVLIPPPPLLVTRSLFRPPHASHMPARVPLQPSADYWRLQHRAAGHGHERVPTRHPAPHQQAQHRAGACKATRVEAAALCCVHLPQ